MKPYALLVVVIWVAIVVLFTKGVYNTTYSTEMARLQEVKQQADADLLIEMQNFRDTHKIAQSPITYRRR